MKEWQKKEIRDGIRKKHAIDAIDTLRIVLLCIDNNKNNLDIEELLKSAKDDIDSLLKTL